MMSTYLIVGGTSGIGLETTKLLSKNHRVMVLSRTKKNLDGLNNVEFFSADVTKSVEELPPINEPIHGIVYCPGTINLKPLRNLKTEDFLHDFEVNLLGAVKVINKYYNNLKGAGKASIVLFSTVAVQTGMPFHASIASAKGAVEGLTRTLAAEFAPNIRVNCLAPSITNTPLAEKLLNNETKMKSSEERHPLKRIGDAKEMAQIVTLLLSDAASFITGQIIKVDGGISSIKLI
ncbi:NAD(P)-dependent dehydrogenase (short-subunit alcohol dehydrogenase family) [Thermonema lapsum]|uniref:NAD(P)-dependent dehydrogenase (Short-subunit alcohol dehydrogenase family) n=1 Tax=Thermonema lapsum TaxID=28195 RepID=A0A846MR71_9BACT|nr:SDR family oxidoreductase [Thermonema lapsum]NIK73955.1 NAD(P)-dependent dehydrogenase (short-subunit alcohol dehydrogenase family) [Thermonema lapsum]